MEATADHDFNANHGDELSFRKGQIIKVLNKDEDPHWFRAELEGKEGLIPSNYITLHDAPWYYGKISRQDAENLLRRQQSGNFLVRQSESCPGDFSISVTVRAGLNNGIQHFKVLRDNKAKYYIWSKRFNSLNEMVAHHKNEPITHPSSEDGVLLIDLEVNTAMVIALFDFTPQESGELAFKRGDIISVLSKDDQSWWEGSLNGQRGVFPCNYVCPYNRSQSQVQQNPQSIA